MQPLQAQPSTAGPAPAGTGVQHVIQTHVFAPVVTGAPVKKQKYNAAQAAAQAQAQVQVANGEFSHDQSLSVPRGRVFRSRLFRLPLLSHQSFKALGLGVVTLALIFMILMVPC